LPQWLAGPDGYQAGSDNMTSICRFIQALGSLMQVQGAVTEQAN
jgi:hypothetical protein